MCDNFLKELTMKWLKVNSPERNSGYKVKVIFSNPVKPACFGQGLNLFILIFNPYQGCLSWLSFYPGFHPGLFTLNPFRISTEVAISK